MKLTDKVHLFRIDFEIPIGPGKTLPRFVNVIMIFGEKITLIDTGVRGSEDKIAAYLRENNRNINEIGTIILSHSHPDHIGAAARIKELSGCRILAHRNEQPWIENLELQNRERPVPGFFSLVGKPVQVSDFIISGQKIKSGPEITLEMIHSPGHSKGSINVLFSEDRILFTADSIPLKDDIPNYDSYHDLVKSLEAIRSNRNFKTLLTSWTAPVFSETGIQELIRAGEEYITRINDAVRTVYRGIESEPLMFCRKTTELLGLPPVYVNPIVDRAFRSHLAV